VCHSFPLNWATSWSENFKLTLLNKYKKKKKKQNFIKKINKKKKKKKKIKKTRR